MVAAPAGACPAVLLAAPGIADALQRGPQAINRHLARQVPQGRSQSRMGAPGLRLRAIGHRYWADMTVLQHTD